MASLKEDPVINVIYEGMRRGINVAIENDCFGSAVILILSAMDAMAYLSMPESQQDVTRADFVRWAEKYIRFPGREQLTGQDLYGARCAVLHSYGARSKMSRDHKCRMVGYMSECYPAIRYNPAVSRELVMVSLPALRDALFEGMDRFLIDLYRDPTSKHAKLADKRFKSLLHVFPYKPQDNSAP